MLNMSSAFDLVNHSILIKDLNHLGVSSSALQLMQSYLSNRSYSVQVNSTLSHRVSLSSGVPQGSILGPLLFNIYMTSLCPILRKYSLDYHIYADDIQLLLPLPLPYETFIDDVLSDIRSWTNSRDLLLNSSKTEFFALHPPRISIPLIPYPLASSIRNLGVIFDTDLSFSSNIVNVSRLCRLTLRYLYPIRPFLDDQSAIKLVHALIFSRIDYCCSLYYHVPRYNLKILQRIINQSCRFVLSPIRCIHTSTHLFNFRWLPIIPRIHFRLCCIVYKLIHGSCQPSYLSNLICQSKGFSRKNLPLIYTRATNESSWSSKSFYFYVPRLYNSLPSHIVSANSFSIFAHSLRSHLFDKSFDPVTHSLTPYATP